MNQPITSIAALKSFDKTGERVRHHRAILASLQIFGEGTFLQIANRTQLTYHQAGRRVSELVDQGKVVDSGKKGVSPSGRSAIVWRLNVEK